MKELNLNELDLVVGGSRDGKISFAVPSRGGIGGFGQGGTPMAGSSSRRWNSARMKRENNFDKNGNQTNKNTSHGRSRREGGGRATEK